MSACLLSKVKYQEQSQVQCQNCTPHLFIKKNHIAMEKLCFIARITEVPEPRDAHADASIAGPGHDICQEQVHHLQTE
jgi:hypothetical protein